MRPELFLPSIAVAGSLAVACATRSNVPSTAQAPTYPPTSLAPLAMGVAEVQPAPTDDAIAIEVLASTTCDRAAVCGLPGSDPEQDACMKQAREAAADDLYGHREQCPHAVETEPLNRCLADLANRPCADKSYAAATMSAARAVRATPSCKAATLCP
jgi:hypothetical protein